MNFPPPPHSPSQPSSIRFGTEYYVFFFFHLLFFPFFWSLKILKVSAEKNVPASLPSPSPRMLIFASTMHRRRTARVPLPPPSNLATLSTLPLTRSAIPSPTWHCSICKINLYRSSIQPEALASLVRGNAAVECRPNGVADCIGSEVRILDRIEPLTAEADLTGEIDCSCPRSRKDTGRASTE